MAVPSPRKTDKTRKDSETVSKLENERERERERGLFKKGACLRKKKRRKRKKCCWKSWN